MKPLLAIIIPYYKINFFEETLKSVAAQTDKRFALYIGNDTSPDDPLPLIQKYFPGGNYQYFSYEENLGGRNLAMQWERILDNVNEEWFQILGDDDVISENFVEEFYSAQQDAHHHQSNVIKFSQCWIDQDSKQLNEMTLYPRVSSIKSIWRSKFIDGKRSSLSEHVFRTSSYRKIKFIKFPLAWYSDDCAILDFSMKKPVIFCNSTRVKVRISEINISSRQDNHKEKTLAKLLYHEYILKHYSAFLTVPELEKELEWYIYQLWTNKKKCKINLCSLFIKTRQWKKALKAPYTKYSLFRNAV